MTNKDILNEYQVVAVGDGKKLVNNKKTKQDAKIFFVKKKYKSPIMKALLKATGRFIPEEVDGEKTDVVEVGNLEFLRTKERPVIGGCSGMLERWTACTIGAIVFKGKKPYILSNEHCLDRWFDLDQTGDRILQPSPIDGGVAERDGIALLTETDHRMIMDGRTHNLFDASIQPLNEGIPYKELYQKQIGEIKNEIVEVKPGDKIKKRGRTTGLTTSEVIATNVVASVWAGIVNRRIVYFENQIFARNRDWSFVNGGDSGSLALTHDNKIFGLIFAGVGGDNGIAVISPIKPIMDTLGFTFVPTEEEEQFHYVAAGREDAWYVKCPTGPTPTTVRLNLRTAPRVHSSTLVRTLPVGTIVDVVDDIGDMGGYRWLKIKRM